MLLLEYAGKNKVPCIDMEEQGRLAFSKVTSHPTKGYRFICYNRSCIERIRIKKKVNGEVVERYTKAEQRDSVVLDMDLMRKVGQRQSKGFPKGTINPRLADWLRKVFKKYVTEDKYFPYDRIDDLKRYLARQSIEKIIAKPQRKRMVKNGKRNKRKSK